MMWKHRSHGVLGPATLLMLLIGCLVHASLGQEEAEDNGEGKQINNMQNHTV